MNNTGTVTYEKVMLTVRLTPETYEKLADRVSAQKKKQRGYSMNQCISELLEKAEAKESDEEALKRIRKEFCDTMPLYVNFTSGRPPPWCIWAESMKRSFSFAISGARWMMPWISCTVSR